MSFFMRRTFRRFRLTEPRPVRFTLSAIKSSRVGVGLLSGVKVDAAPWDWALLAWLDPEAGLGMVKGSGVGLADMFAELLMVKNNWSVVLSDEDSEEGGGLLFLEGVTWTVKSGVIRSGFLDWVPGIKFRW
jgi:hypothetical protein